MVILHLAVLKLLKFGTMYFMMILAKNQSLAVLPNQQPLFYSYPWLKGNQSSWWMHEICQKLLQVISKAELKMAQAKNLDEFKAAKKQLPKLGLLSNPRSNQHLIAADIDTLPKGFNSFDEVKTVLEVYNSDGVQRCLVVDTPTSKAKALFLVEHQSELNLNVARNFLKDILPPEILEVADLSYGGMFVVFLTSSNVNQIHQGVPRLNCFNLNDDIIDDHKELIPEHPVTPEVQSESKPWRKYEGELPDTLKRVISKRSPHDENILRILLNNRNLIGDGFGLSQRKLASEAGCPPMVVNRLIKRLTKIKYLMIIDDKFIEGVKPIIYKADGELATQIELLNKSTVHHKSEMPAIIQDGSWNDVGFEMIKALKGDREALLVWFKSVEGHDLKNRLERFEYQIDQYHLYKKNNN